MIELLPIVKEVINDWGSVSGVAQICGIDNPSILLNQLNPNNTQHKLGAETLRQIVRTCRPYSIKIAQVFASDSDAIAIPKPQPKPAARRDLLKLILQLGKEYGDVSATINQAIDENSEGGVDITINELAALDKEIIEAYQVFRQIFDVVKRLAEAPNNTPT